MKSWSDFDLLRDTKKVCSEKDSSIRTFTGLRSETKGIVETSYQRISDPIYDVNDPEVVFGVVENFYGRCGIFGIKLPYNEKETIQIKWLPENVKSVKYLKGRIFWLHDLVMKPVWVACFKRGEWEIHSII